VIRIADRAMGPKNPNKPSTEKWFPVDAVDLIIKNEMVLHPDTTFISFRVSDAYGTYTIFYDMHCANDDSVDMPGYIRAYRNVRIEENENDRHQ
jgi:hypothetical protein